LSMSGIRLRCSVPGTSNCSVPAIPLLRQEPEEEEDEEDGKSDDIEDENDDEDEDGYSE
jgi:hypothetical protein